MGLPKVRYDGFFAHLFSFVLNISTREGISNIQILTFDYFFYFVFKFVGNVGYEFKDILATVASSLATQVRKRK